MSEEEEEAFEIVKNITKKDLLDCWDYGEKEFKAIQTILNLIEKQQKEIEDLYKYKADNDSYKVSEVNKYVNRILEGFVSKAKIRKKIKELEEEKNKYFMKVFIQNHITLLKELLEENNNE